MIDIYSKMYYTKYIQGRNYPKSLVKYIWLTKTDTSQEPPASKSESSSLTDKKSKKYADGFKILILELLQEERIKKSLKINMGQ